MARVDMNTKQNRTSKRRPIVQGKVNKSEASNVKKFKDVFFGAEVEDVKSFLIFDVLLPGIKDSIMSSMEIMFYGKTKGRNGRTGYSKCFNGGSSNGHEGNGRRRFDLDDVTFEYRSDALAVLDELQDIIDADGEVSVADLYELCGMDTEHTDYKYGWTNLRSADVIGRKGEFVLDLPKAKAL